MEALGVETFLNFCSVESGGGLTNEVSHDIRIV